MRILVCLLLPLMYFAPTIAAYFKKHPHLGTIFWFNLFFGFTIFGWFAALYCVGTMKAPGRGVLLFLAAAILFMALLSWPGYRAAMQASYEAAGRSPAPQ